MQDSIRLIVQRYSVSLVTTALAIWLRLTLEPILLDRVPFGLFFLSVLLTAWIAGFGPALLALLLGILGAAHYVIPPHNSLAISAPSDQVSLGVYSVVGFVSALLFESLRRAHRVMETSHQEIAELNQDLREANQRKDAFLALLAHELRNPLAPIRSGLELVARSSEKESLAEQTCEMMQRQVEQLSRLVDDLLDASRFVSGVMELRKDWVELRDIAQLAIETAEPFCRQMNHTITVTLPTVPIWIYGDRARLAQMLSNVLNNSAKYTPPQGQIRFWAEMQQDSVQIRIRDNGIGIPTELLPQIFDLFIQGEDAKGRAQGGLGIGLALVREIVALHDGSISAASRGAGQGSEFTIRLPAQLQPAEEPKPAPPALEPAPAEIEPSLKQKIKAEQPRLNQKKAPRGLRIMLVDDNRDAIEMLGALLMLEGHEIRLVYDGPSALDLALEFNPQVILMDIGLPGMDGHEVVQRLRLQDRFQDSWIVALTGWGSQADQEKSLAAGCDYHLIKPVELEKLMPILDQAKQSGRSARQPASKNS